MDYPYGTEIARNEYNDAIYRVFAGFPNGKIQRAGVDISYDNGETWNSTSHPAIRLTGDIAVDKQWGMSNLTAYNRSESYSDMMHSCFVGRYWECEGRTVTPHAVCASDWH